MISIPQNIQELKSYQPGKPISQLIEEYKLDEIAVLWNNENNHGFSPLVKDAITNAIETSNLYPDAMSFELRTALAERNNRNYNEITIGNGSEEILSNINKAFIEQEEELLTSEGSFVSVYVWAKASNIKLKTVPLKPDYSFDLDAIYNAITEKTKVIYLANANNPTGSMLNKTELLHFIEKVPKHIIIVVDEAYIEYSQSLFGDLFPVSSLFKKENVITLRTFSKAYGLAGIRVGYSIAPEKLTEALLKVKMTFAPSNLSQAAALAALKDQDFVAFTTSENKKGIQLFYDAFDELGLNYCKSACNFVMVYFETTDEASRFTNDLIKKGVFVRQLKAFGLPHCVRISVGTAKENAFCIHQIGTLK
tara:strand:- start:331 stop:1425 length:1095 start_codon:yes stop_codon:yes gene_type:complete